MGIFQPLIGQPGLSRIPKLNKPMRHSLLCTHAAHSCLNKRVVYRLFLIFWFFLIKQKERKKKHEILIVKTIHRPGAAIILRVVVGSGRLPERLFKKKRIKYGMPQVKNTCSGFKRIKMKIA
jgi:hypothetical protein